jgi:glutaredoxin 3
MPEVTIYCTAMCPYCLRAKKLLENKNVSYTEIRLDEHPERRGEMVQRANGRTSVPQIFIDDYHVGGFDDMVELDIDDELDPMLGIS